MSAQDDYLGAQERLLSEHGVTATSRFVRLPWRGLRTHILESGEGDPLVFVIGGGAFAALWAPLLARIPGYKLYAMDRPGFGLTEPVEHRPETLRDTAVGFLGGVLDALDIERATLVANSIGSQWTFWLALDCPGRVARMVHIGCPVLLLDTIVPMPLPLLGAPVLGRLMMSLTPPSPRQARMVFAGMNEREAMEKDPALETAVIATERLPGYGPAWRSLIGSVHTPFKARKGVRLTAGELRRIRQPVQLIWGRDEPQGPVAAGERAVDLMPDARFAVVPGGHLPWLDSPDQVSEVVNEFLRSSG